MARTNSARWFTPNPQKAPGRKSIGLQRPICLRHSSFDLTTDEMSIASACRFVHVCLFVPCRLVRRSTGNLAGSQVWYAHSSDLSARVYRGLACVYFHFSHSKTKTKTRLRSVPAVGGAGAGAGAAAAPDRTSRYSPGHLTQDKIHPHSAPIHSHVAHKSTTRAPARCSLSPAAHRTRHIMALND